MTSEKIDLYWPIVSHNVVHSDGENMAGQLGLGWWELLSMASHILVGLGNKEVRQEPEMDMKVTRH